MAEGIVCACFCVLVLAGILLASRLHHLEKELEKMKETLHILRWDLSALNEKVSEAYDVAEAQAKQEKLMFDGLNSIMDYDISAARKAVRNDGEG